MIWQELEGAYPGRWIRTVGPVQTDAKKLSLTARRWATIALKHERSDVREALAWLTTKRDGLEFLPALGQFAQSCADFKRRRLAQQDEAVRVDVSRRLSQLEPDARMRAKAKLEVAEAYASLGYRMKAAECRFQALPDRCLDWRLGVWSMRDE